MYVKETEVMRRFLLVERNGDRQMIVDKKDRNSCSKHTFEEEGEQ